MPTACVSSFDQRRADDGVGRGKVGALDLDMSERRTGGEHTIEALRRYIPWNILEHEDLKRPPCLPRAECVLGQARVRADSEAILPTG